jgi:PPM family protein phosphatase
LATLPDKKPRVSVVAAGATDTGQGRDQNEDAVLLSPDLDLFVVADGTGGAGVMASTIATTTIAESFRETRPPPTLPLPGAALPDRDAFGLYYVARRLVSAIQKANLAIHARRKSAPELDAIGTTVVAAAATPGSGVLHVAHVGDSRCYRYRGGELEQLTDDHSLLNDILETRPDVEDTVLARLPQNVVTRGLGMEVTVRVSIKSYPMRSRDRYILCSDGLSDTVSPDHIAEVLRRQTSPRKTTRALIDLANANGAQDNIAVIVIQCKQGAPAKRPSFRPKRGAVTVPPAGVHEGSEPEIHIKSIMQAPDGRDGD